MFRTLRQYLSPHSSFLLYSPPAMALTVATAELIGTLLEAAFYGTWFPAAAFKYLALMARFYRNVPPRILPMSSRFLFKIS